MCHEKVAEGVTHTPNSLPCQRRPLRASAHFCVMFFQLRSRTIVLSGYRHADCGRLRCLDRLDHWEVKGANISLVRSFRDHNQAPAFLAFLSGVPKCKRGPSR